MPLRPYADDLESLYLRLNCRRYVQPDPVEVLYRYRQDDDREVVAVLAACLAYGRVGHILRSVNDALERLGDRPARRLADSTPRELARAMRGFKHRFCTGDHLSRLLQAVRAVRRSYGSLGAAFAAGLAADDATVLPALVRWVAELKAHGAPDAHVLPDPARGGASKRMHLFLRWMVRRDAVDPGGWDRVGPERLIVPLDVHMHRMAQRMGATRRRSADAKTALEVTDVFRRVRPDDPVRYDFALTRLGIRDDVEPGGLLDRLYHARR